jgi:hypothetical protein
MVLEPATRRFLRPEPTSTLIWSRLAEPASPEQLADYIADHFQGVTPAAALQDVRAIIDEMTARASCCPSHEGVVAAAAVASGKCSATGKGAQ